MFQPVLNIYLNLCTQVYELSKPVSPQDAYAFYLDYAKKAEGPILEPMCGTGRFLLPLLEAGCDIQGFDASSHMLQALQTKAQLKQLKPNVWRSFIENFKTNQQYRLILIPSGSFGFITDINTVQKVLKRFYEHLTHHGILLLEVETMHAIQHELEKRRESEWKRQDGKIIRLQQLAIMKNDVCHSTGIYELMDGSTLLETETEEYVVRLYEEQQMATLLKNAGFKKIKALKAFDPHQHPGRHDASIVFECGK